MRDRFSNLQNIYPTIAFNVHNYLNSKKIKPSFFLGWTCAISDEDKAVSRELDIPLIDKAVRDYAGFFPSIDNLSKEAAWSKYARNWKERLL